MTPNDAFDLIIRPTLAYCDEPYDTPKAAVMLMAIGMQESGFQHRTQVGGGPGRGFWQFEPGVKVPQLLTTVAQHASCKDLRDLIRMYGFTPSLANLYGLLDKNDVVACIVARAGLWQDPQPLPELVDADAAWAYYVRVWGPGKPSRQRWVHSYNTALKVIL